MKDSIQLASTLGSFVHSFHISILKKISMQMCIRYQCLCRWLNLDTVRTNIPLYSITSTKYNSDCTVNTTVQLTHVVDLPSPEYGGTTVDPPASSKPVDLNWSLIN